MGHEGDAGGGRGGRAGARPLRLEDVVVERPLRLARPAAPPRTPVPLRTPAAPPPFTPPEDGRWTGALLREARERRELTVAELAVRTKVTRHHIENVEAERYERLPPPAYLRGVLLSIAKELRLDGEAVARGYPDPRRR